MQALDLERFIRLNYLKKIDLAEYLGVSPSFISKILKGHSQLPHDKFMMLCEHPTWNKDALFGNVKYKADMTTAPPLPDGTMPDVETLNEGEDEEAERHTLTTEQRLLAQVESLTYINNIHARNIAELIAQQGRLITLLENRKK